MKKCGQNMDGMSRIRRSGFTIVELLIVIVVIAILAAISVVAYNGIQSRARVSTASSAISQAQKKIAIWQVDNPGQTPPALINAGIADTGNTTHQYRRYDSNSSYCLGVTLNGNNSYYAESSSPSTVNQGSCSDVSSVAGQPLAINTSAGSVVSFSALSGTPDIILYTVFQVNNLNDAWYSIASMQPQATNKIMQLDTNDTGSPNLRYRVDTSATTNASASQGARTVGRHIGWLQIRNNMTVREFAYDQASAVNNASMLPGTGWDFSQLRLGSSTASTQSIAAVAYNAAHDQQTRARVMQYLADTYGVSASY